MILLGKCLTLFHIFRGNGGGTAIGKFHCHCLPGFKLFACTMVVREMKKGGAVFGTVEKKRSPPPPSLSKK